LIPLHRTVAFKKRRCLIPVDGFRMEESPRRQNLVLDQHEDDSPFGLPGYGKAGKIRQTMRGCISARHHARTKRFVREIHTRMPVILPEEHHDDWLSGEAGKEILVPFPEDRMKAWPIDARVNSPKNNDPGGCHRSSYNPKRYLTSDPRIDKLLEWRKAPDSRK
jgi:putative SOS response-associated peptidase YedK